MCDHNPIIETNPAVTNLSVGLGDSLNLILLLDGERVGGFLGAVHDFVGQALSTRLDVSEGAVSSTLSDQRESLIDSSKRRDIDSLSSDNTTRSDTGGIFASTSVLDGVNKDLYRVLIGQKMNDLESLLDDSNSHLLLTVVSTLHHHGVDESLNNWAGGLSESLLLVATSSVREIHSS